MKPLPGNALTLARRAEVVYTTWDVEIDSVTTPIEWLFQPQFWIHVAGHLKKGDLIRIHAKDASYDFMAVVTGKTTGGKLAARIKVWPTIPNAVREAELAMAAGALVSKNVNGKPCPRVEHVEADGWRLVGLDNTVHSRGYETEEHALSALAQYLSVYGIKGVAPSPAAPAEKKLEPIDKLPKELDVAFNRRKEADKRLARDEQRAADMEALEKRRQEIAATKN